MTHISVGKSTTIGSDNGLSPDRCQAITLTNAGILLIGPLGTYFSEILTGIQTFSIQENALENVVCEMAPILSRPQCVDYLGVVWQPGVQAKTYPVGWGGYSLCEGDG